MHPMRFVFDVPVAPHPCEQPRCVGAFRRQTGDPAHPFLADLSSLFPDDLAVELKHLRHPWPVTIASPHVTGVQLPLLDAAMSVVHGLRHRAGLSHDGREGKDGRNVLS